MKKVATTNGHSESLTGFPRGMEFCGKEPGLAAGSLIDGNFYGCSLHARRSHRAMSLSMIALPAAQPITRNGNHPNPITQVGFPTAILSPTNGGSANSNPSHRLVSALEEIGYIDLWLLFAANASDAQLGHTGRIPHCLKPLCQRRNGHHRRDG
jgi:hypothetical protein